MNIPAPKSARDHVADGSAAHASIVQNMEELKAEQDRFEAQAHQKLDAIPAETLMTLADYLSIVGISQNIPEDREVARFMFETAGHLSHHWEDLQFIEYTVDENGKHTVTEVQRTKSAWESLMADVSASILQKSLGQAFGIDVSALLSGR